MTADPTTPTQAVVQITVGQIYSEVKTTGQDVRDMKGTVAAVLNMATDHETRIRSLERRVWMAIGMGTIGSLIAGYAITLYTSAH